MIKIESSGNHKAKSKTGPEGLTQVARKTAKSLGYNANTRMNPAINLKTAVDLAKDNQRVMINNKIPVTELTLYWAHNLGAPTLKKLYKYLTKGTPIDDAGMDIIKLNLKKKSKYGKDPIVNYLNWTREQWIR